MATVLELLRPSMIYRDLHDEWEHRARNSHNRYVHPAASFRWMARFFSRGHFCCTGQSSQTWSGGSGEYVGDVGGRHTKQLSMARNRNQDSRDEGNGRHLSALVPWI